MKETFDSKQIQKSSLKKTLATVKTVLFEWILSIVFIVKNFKNVQEIVNHQNKEIDEMRMLVNFLLKNTNRFVRRRWSRYLDHIEESGVWDPVIVKLHPREKMYHNQMKDEFNNFKERTPQEVVNILEREVPYDPVFCSNIQVSLTEEQERNSRTPDEGE